MGNKSALAAVTMDDDEFLYAPGLIAAVSTNKAARVKDAIEAARRKCADFANQNLTYEEMTRKMLKYLTSRYRCYGPDADKCTVLDFAQASGAGEAAVAVQAAIADLERAIAGIESKRGPSTSILSLDALGIPSTNSKGSGKDSTSSATTAPSGVAREDVTRERVHQAKARLQAFRDQGAAASSSSASSSTSGSSSSASKKASSKGK